jgi:hypothetical protein
MAERKRKPLDEAAIRRDERAKTLRYVVRVLRAEAKSERRHADDLPPLFADAIRRHRQCANALANMADSLLVEAHALAGKANRP